MHSEILLLALAADIEKAFLKPTKTGVNGKYQR
jgi:hypothetical protein